ncbi:related to SNP1 - U1 small nuclear ribonucleoprotein [Pseudozyma flocculosa]|uniref:U1 small nuclear ribonucleoprotein 70 kDa n=1 Tax=Pseudozyma flocculosa TaxID=84751 RepID=A0A5C3FF07_9BASI|nr:related to SNP1 - U1 small nuclear ribonucleoprotein [Pseudozyma flocculosa]
MTHQLPPNLIRLFTSRPPLPYTPPLPGDQDPNDPPQPKDRDEISNRKKVRPLDGVAAFLERVKQEAADRGEATDDIDEQGQAQQFTHAKITLAEMAKEEKKRKKEQEKKEGLEKYDPNKDPEAIGDPFKTLFLARLSYDTTEKDLHREFDMYGPIERIRLVRDKEGKSRGYAFVLYERERDMRAAYKDAEGLKINGRRIMVDVERGRAVKDWKPTRLGGGLGGLTRKPKKAEEPEPFGGGGFRGGGRGGFRGGFGGRGGGGGFGGGFRGGRGGGFGGGRGGFGGGPPPMGGGGGFGGPPRGGFGGGGSGGGPPRGYGGPPGPPGGGPPGYGAGPPPGSRGGYGGGYGGGGGGYDDGPPAKRGRY